MKVMCLQMKTDILQRICTMTKTYEVEIQKDTKTDDLFFEIPPELLKNLNWKTGDDLKWGRNKRRSFC